MSLWSVSSPTAVACYAVAVTYIPGSLAFAHSYDLCLKMRRS